MHFKFLNLVGLSSLVSALTNAPVTHGNNPHIKYRATLPGSSSTPIRGAISGHASNNGTGIIFNVNFTHLPTDSGPYLYHIHENPVPADGNCTSTGPHLDPFNRTETPSCDSTLPATCQVGDLSGKHGRPISGTFSVKYRDVYLSTVSGTAAFFGNRSVVIHNKDKVRLTCANFEVVTDTNSTTTATGTSAASSVPPSATGSPIATGGAAAASASRDVSGVLVLIMAIALLL
ncbi:MAG: hypothetical protein GOMPHAMPRED_003500 [Gomphillus americanus]|uniref:superoxide dismutase n=1 Tax=Gomphillus americanus TaxID=1940652 RepID=A0A8H3FG53_9LECA|nr:MAG: hypothetical protein GOMPHAMPRED_003500 [Gomphillus americanus]